MKQKTCKITLIVNYIYNMQIYIYIYMCKQKITNLSKQINQLLEEGDGKFFPQIPEIV